MSKLVLWQDFYSVQVAEIDKQHQHLFDLLNELYDSYEMNNADNITSKIIEQLASYALYHFKTEEQYFIKYHYKNAAAHFAEHSRFVKQIHEFRNEFARNSMVLTPKLFNFLKDWINKHILESDQMYVDCFIRNGLR